MKVALILTLLFYSAWSKASTDFVSDKTDKFLQALGSVQDLSKRGQIVQAKSYLSNKVGYTTVIDLKIRRSREIDSGFTQLSRVYYEETFSIWFEDKDRADSFMSQLSSNRELIFFYKESNTEEFKNKHELPGRLLFSFDPLKKEIKPIVF